MTVVNGGLFPFLTNDLSYPVRMPHFSSPIKGNDEYHNSFQF
jgi:hypothetical protein